MIENFVKTVFNLREKKIKFGHSVPTIRPISDKESTFSHFFSIFLDKKSLVFMIFFLENRVNLNNRMTNIIEEICPSPKSL